MMMKPLIALRLLEKQKVSQKYLNNHAFRNQLIFDILGHYLDLIYTLNFVLELEIAVLVNNVGLSYEFPAPYLEIEGGTNEFSSDLIKCNITSVNTMTALVLPQVLYELRGYIYNKIYI